MELVDEHVPETAAHAFKKKRHGVVTHHPRDAFVQGMKCPDVAVGLHVFHLLGNRRQGANQIDLVDESLAQQVGRTLCRPRGHVRHLGTHRFCFRQHARDRLHRRFRRFLGSEDPFVEHRLQSCRRRLGLALTLLSDPLK